MTEIIQNFKDAFWAIWQSGNIPARQALKYYLLLVVGSVAILASISSLGYGQIVPYLMVPLMLGLVFWFGLFARITCDPPTQEEQGRIQALSFWERWNVRVATSGEPVLVIAADLLLYVRLILAGIPVIIGLYAWLIPMNTRPGWVMGLIFSVMGLIVFTGAKETDWPWAKVGRTASVGMFIILTLGFFTPSERVELWNYAKEWEGDVSVPSLGFSGRASASTPTPTPKPLVLAPANAVPTSVWTRKNGPFPVTVTQDNGEWIHITYPNTSMGLSHMKWRRDESTGLFWEENDGGRREMIIGWVEKAERWHGVDDEKNMSNGNKGDEFWLGAGFIALVP